MEVPEPDIIIYAWYLCGVKSVIASGSSNFISLVDENTVLKYPQLPLEMPQGLDSRQEKIYRILRQQQLAGLGVEEQILGVLGEHRRIIPFKGKHEEGLLLERMPNRSVADYLPNADPQPPIQKRLKWALHAAEAVAYIYTKRVIHCDIGSGNLLFDKNLNVRVSDFQGRLLYPDGTICLNGDSAEGVRLSMPRSDPDDANQETDIFALGSAIYFMLKGYLPFPELDSWRDRLEIVSRFKAKQFPALDNVQGGNVVKKC